MTNLLDRLRAIDPALCGSESLRAYSFDEKYFGNEIVILRQGRRMLIRIVQDRGFVELEWAECPDHQIYDLVCNDEIVWRPIKSAPPAIPPMLVHKLQGLCSQ